MNTNLIVQDWLDVFAKDGGTVGKGLANTAAQAQRKAVQYEQIGTAYDDFQPGNGTSYALMLHDLVRAQADMITSGRSLAVRRAYVQARSMGPAARWGGEMLIALPNLGKSAVIGMHGLTTPWFVAEQLLVGYADAVHLAAYLTFFCDGVLNARSAA